MMDLLLFQITYLRWLQKKFSAGFLTAYPTIRGIFVNIFLCKEYSQHKQSIIRLLSLHAFHFIDIGNKHVSS